VSLGGVQILVGGVLSPFIPLPTGGIAAPLMYVSPTQINFQVPYATPTGSAVPVVLIRDGSMPVITQAAFQSAAPAIFAYPRTASTSDPVILHADNTLVTPEKPARAGEILVIYGTGSGPLNNPPADGAAAPTSPPATTKDKPLVTVGGAAATVLFSGLAPGFAGLLQINIQLPATLPPGPSAPLVVSFPAASSIPVNLWVTSSPTAVTAGRSAVPARR
jgi:uncharacterized protein (TIGR03437 family)